MHLLTLQVLLAVATAGEPVRFGVPLPDSVLRTGLTLQGPGELRWRPLPAAVRDGRCWVEVAISGADGRARLKSGNGGDGAMPQPEPICCTTRQGEIDRTEWHFADGTVDWRERTAFSAPTVIGGEAFAAGEALTRESPSLARRCLPVASLPREVWEPALLPPDRGLAAPIREHLRLAAAALVELPGLRGAGDYGRSDGVVTNLEFDTTLALLRLGLALGDEQLVLRARRAAFHLCDRDMDRATGLPFAHGPDHRSRGPEPGHAWLQGLLWTGLVCAEEPLLDAARQIARALCSQPPMGEGPTERARDYAWPLLELEGYLALVGDPLVERGADRLALAIAGRYRSDLRTFCFGEGDVRGPGYFERAWITGGVVLPALRAHLRRRPDRALQRAVDAVTDALLDRVGQGRGGLPTHWRIAGGATFAERRAVADCKAMLLLEGLPPADLRRLLRRPRVLAGMSGVPALDDPDLATALTMVARCSWVYR